LAGWAAAILVAGFAGAANAQGAVKSVHGDWQIRCDTPPGAKAEQCALIQSVVAEDRANAGLTVIVLKTADQKSRLMRVVAPLGVLLPSGLGLGDTEGQHIFWLDNEKKVEVVVRDATHVSVRNNSTEMRKGVLIFIW
jgi:invasion protein IalB